MLQSIEINVEIDNQGMKSEWNNLKFEMWLLTNQNLQSTFSLNVKPISSHDQYIDQRLHTTPCKLSESIMYTILLAMHLFKIAMYNNCTCNVSFVATGAQLWLHERGFQDSHYQWRYFVGLYDQCHRLLN